MKNQISIQEFCNWIDNYLNFEKTPQKDIFWLETMNFFCQKMNHPENKTKCFHVAGSKGKGSVSVMIAGILEEMNKSCGIYTSPHLIDFRERIATLNGFLSDEIYSKSAEELINCVDSVKDEELPGNRRITWFELVTLYSFLCFKNAGFDYSVYEVGLGGRLDSTNVVKPECSVINTIELEHTEFLGDTVEKIAFEKGGIIKENVPVVIAGQSESVKQVFRNIAAEKHSPILFADEKGSVENIFYKDERMCFTLKAEGLKRPLSVKLKLLGKVQAQNALLAVLAVKQVFPDVDESILEKGLENAVLSGRFEILKANENHGKIILDGAHTFNSVKYSIETLKAIYPDEKFNLLFGCAKDKKVEEISSLFVNDFNGIYLTKPGTVKQSDLLRMENAFSEQNLKFHSSEDFVSEIRKSVEESKNQNKILLVTGSFYLVTEVKKLLNQ